VRFIVKRRAPRSRAANTLDRTCADSLSAGDTSPSRSSVATRPTSTCRSMRSRSGPLRRLRYARTSRSRHRQRTCGPAIRKGIPALLFPGGCSGPPSPFRRLSENAQVVGATPETPPTRTRTPAAGRPPRGQYGHGPELGDARRPGSGGSSRDAPPAGFLLALLARGRYG
jgi:hypothetical protein